MSQRTPLVPASAVPSSPTMPSSGRAGADAVDDERLGGAVHLGDHVGGRRLRGRRSTGAVSPSIRRALASLGQLRREREERRRLGASPPVCSATAHTVGGR